MQDLPIIQKTYDLIKWYVPILNRLPSNPLINIAKNSLPITQPPPTPPETSPLSPGSSIRHAIAPTPASTIVKREISWKVCCVKKYDVTQDYFPRSSLKIANAIGCDRP